MPPFVPARSTISTGLAALSSLRKGRCSRLSKHGEELNLCSQIRKWTQAIHWRVQGYWKSTGPSHSEKAGANKLLVSLRMQPLSADSIAYQLGNC